MASKIIDLSIKIKDFKGKPLKDKEGIDIILGEMLLGILSQNLKAEKKRDSFWITELGVMIANAKGLLEISEEKFEFLKQIVDNNKVVGGRGEESYYVPFVHAQIMQVFIDVDEKDTKKKK